MPATSERTTDPTKFALRSAAEKFDISTQRERWNLWLQQWEVFLIISGIENLVTTTDNADDPVKKRAKARCTMAALKQAFTIDTLETMNSLGLTDDQLQDHQAIIDAMTTHINGTSTPWVKRMELLSRKRQEGEAFDDFLASLRYTAGKCRLDQRMRDFCVTMAVIMGVREPEVTEKLLRMPDDTSLDDFAIKARAIMASKADQSAITKGAKPAAHRVQVVDRPPPQPAMQRRRPTPQPAIPGGCNKCGNGRHVGGRPCPALQRRCVHCNTMGHYGRCCPARQPGQTPTQAPSATTAHAYQPPHNYQTEDAISPYNAATNSAVATNTNPPRTRAGPTALSANAREPTRAAPPPLTPFKPLPLTPISISGAEREIPFLADTGANFSVMSIEHYRAAGLSEDDIDTRTTMARDPEMADGNTGGMNIIGVARVQATAGQKTIPLELYVAERARHPLLSRDATLGLEVLPRPRDQ